MIGSRFLHVCFCFWLIYGASSAHAASIFVGSRSLAMGGAHRGLGNSNDALVLNPAGMAQGQRYILETHYVRESSARTSFLNASIVDSKSGPIAGGLSYTRTWGGADGFTQTLNTLVAATAFRLTAGLSFGANFQHVRGTTSLDNFAEQSTTTHDASDNSFSLGLLYAIPGSFGFGLTFSNSFHPAGSDYAPRALGAGLSFSPGPITFATDIRMLVEENRPTQYTAHLGSEFFLAQTLALRAGYRADFQVLPGQLERARYHALSVGFAFITPEGSLDISAQEALGNQRQRVLAGSIKLFF